MDKQSIKYLSRYMTITDEVKNKITKHCRRYGISEEVCAFYSDMEDFYSYWCDGLGYTRIEARQIYHGGIGEFQTFSNGNIIRYVI